jgi:predicted kinase
MAMSKVVPTKPLLIMLYGFPGSGKSYVARQLASHIQAAHVQGDRIRNELFETPRYDRQENAVVAQLMDYMTEEFLNAGISVIYDANALRSAQRHALRDIARKAHAQPLVVWLQIDVDSAYARTQQRDRRKADDKYAPMIDRNNFNNVLTQMQNPSMSEDYVVISGKHVFSTQLSAIMKKLHDMNLILSDDVSSGVVKPELVNLVPNPNSGRVNMARRRNIMIR